jgi:hypothetical protein
MKRIVYVLLLVTSCAIEATRTPGKKTNKSRNSLKSWCNQYNPSEEYAYDGFEAQCTPGSPKNRRNPQLTSYALKTNDTTLNNKTLQQSALQPMTFNEAQSEMFTILKNQHSFNAWRKQLPEKNTLLQQHQFTDDAFKRMRSEIFTLFKDQQSLHSWRKQNERESADELKRDIVLGIFSGVRLKRPTSLPKKLDWKQEQVCHPRNNVQSLFEKW